VDYEIRLARVHHFYGLGGCLLQWFRSYLTGRSLSDWYIMAVNPSRICCGFLFFLCWTQLRSLQLPNSLVFQFTSMLMISNRVNTHSIWVQGTGITALCVQGVKAWMASSWLCLNPPKIKFIWLCDSRYGTFSFAWWAHWTWMVCLSDHYSKCTI